MRYSDNYGFYELNPFPGSNQLCVSSHAFIYPEFRGRGFGQKQHHERLEKAKELGYDALICTVKSENDIETHILRKFGWTYCNSYVNRETGNIIQIWTINLEVVL